MKQSLRTTECYKTMMLSRAHGNKRGAYSAACTLYTALKEGGVIRQCEELKDSPAAFENNPDGWEWEAYRAVARILIWAGTPPTSGE